MTTASRRIRLDLQSPDLRRLVAEQIGAVSGFEVCDTLPADLTITDKPDTEQPCLLIDKGGALSVPLRLGAVVDQVRYLLSPRLKHSARADAPLPLGPFRLLADTSTLEHIESGAQIRLTDKERLFLQTLAAAPGRRLDRRALLETVWDYADGVETHTLETHLYRLRQKLEACGGAGLILSQDGVYVLEVETPA